MKQFHFIFLFIFSIIGGMGAVVNLNAAAPDSPNLEMYVFSVGQGNFILLKKDDRFLVVDVGCGAQGRNPLKQYKDKMNFDGKLRKKLINIGFFDVRNSCVLLVTHNHWDHFCLFSNLNRVVSTPFSFYENQGSSIALDFWRIRRDKVVDCGSIINCLGGGSTVSCLVPPSNAEKAHEKNLIVFVKYGKVLFILPGDADGDYLNLNAGAFMDILRGESNGCTHCCIVLPHHGSNSNGTLALTLAAHRVLLENGCGEVIFIISSNPMENDHLPRPAVLPLLPNIPKAVMHFFQDSDDVGPLPLITLAPVFITCRATDGIGYLVTTDGNNLQLFDGTTPIRLLYPVQ
ncbi:MAG: hypothetical protein LBJ13_02100 [Puniceicoccales bacterium]|jgi:beta-lactamase superfamily II metal-dependent hydrolase|nr:hypothetical protein [Puniceicoccales bacterium]